MTTTSTMVKSIDANCDRIEQKTRILEIAYDRDKDSYKLKVDIGFNPGNPAFRLMLYNIKDKKLGMENFEAGQEVFLVARRSDLKKEGNPGVGHDYWWNLVDIQFWVDPPTRDLDTDLDPGPDPDPEGDTGDKDTPQGRTGGNVIKTTGASTPEKYDIYLVSQSQRIAFDGINIGNLKPPQGYNYEDMSNEQIIEWGYYLRDLIIHHSLTHGVRTPEQWAAHFTHREAEADYQEDFLAVEKEVIGEAYHAHMEHYE